MKKLSVSFILQRCVFINLLLVGLFSSRFSLAAPPAISLTEQDIQDLKKIEEYFNNIQTLQAHFSQYTKSGMSAGTIYIRRPNQMRVEYNPPVPVLIVASGRLVSYYDKELNQLTEAPLSSTPLGLILAQPFSLQKGTTITKIARSPQELQVILYQSAQPDAGLLELVFTTTPFQIKYWRVIDSANRSTQVVISNIKLNNPLSNNLFTRPSQIESNTR